MSPALRRYRVMALVVGVGLVLLVVVGMPLKYLAGQPLVVKVVGPLHGFLYLVYLAAVLDLALRARLGLGRVAAMVLAGVVPFLSFVVERHTTAALAGSSSH